MQRTFEYGVNNGVSPATVELLIRERSKGKTLRQLVPEVHRAEADCRNLKACPSQFFVLYNDILSG